jgi:hypothetical protein
MLLYSVTEADDRATFTVDDDGSLVFSTRLPFGTVNINFADGYNVATPLLPDRSNLPTSDMDGALIAPLVGRYYFDVSLPGSSVDAQLLISEDGEFAVFDSSDDLLVHGSGVVEPRMGGFTLVFDDDPTNRVDFVLTDGELIFDGVVPFGDMVLGSANDNTPVTARAVGERSPRALDVEQEVEEGDSEDETEVAAEANNEPETGADDYQLYVPEAQTEDTTVQPTQAPVTQQPTHVETQPSVPDTISADTNEYVPSAPPAPAGPSGVFVLTLTRHLEAMGGIEENLTFTIDLDSNTFTYFGEQITRAQGTLETAFNGTFTGSPETGFTFTAPDRDPFTATVVETANGRSLEFSPANALLPITSLETVVLAGFE